MCPLYKIVVLLEPPSSDAVRATSTGTEVNRDLTLKDIKSVDGLLLNVLCEF